MKSPDTPLAALTFGHLSGRAALFALSYFAMAELGHGLTFGPNHSATVWPPIGLYVAVLSRGPWRHWPVFLLAAFAGNCASDMVFHGKSLAVAVGFWAGNSASAVFGAWLLSRMGNGPFVIARLPDVLFLALFAALVPVVSASIGSLTIIMAFPDTTWRAVWPVWWAADLVGLLVFAPLVWQFPCPSMWRNITRVPMNRLVEAALMLGAVVGATQVFFGMTRGIPMAYITLPPLLWPGLRFGIRGVAVAMVGIAIVVFHNTGLGSGPFGGDELSDWTKVFLAQTFVGSSTLAALVLGTATSDRQQALLSISQANAELEARVRQRTDELREANRVLGASEERYRVLAEGVPQLVWTATPDGSCNYLNQQWEDYAGQPAALHLGDGWAEAIHPDDRARVLGQWRYSVQNHHPLDIDVRIRGARGTYRWFKVRAVLIGQNSQATWLGTCTDVHEKKLIEEELQNLNATLEKRVAERTDALVQREQRFRAIFHSQFQFIGLMSPDGILLEANRTALAAAGVREEEVLGKPFWETEWWLHDADQQERLRQAVARAANGIQDRFEASHPTHDGNWIWVDFSFTPFFDEQGQVVLLIPEGRDITARKQAEEALRLQEELFRGAFDYAAIGMAMVAPTGRWLRVNSALCTLLGFSAQELLAIDFQSITHPGDLEVDLALSRQLLASVIPVYHMEKRYFHKRGKIVHVLLNVTLVRDGKGAPLYFIKQIEDITQRKKMN